MLFRSLRGILGDVDDTMLPEGSVDLVLLVDAYHEFDHPWEMANSIARALRPGGRLALVEFRAEGSLDPMRIAELLPLEPEPSTQKLTGCDGASGNVGT